MTDFALRFDHVTKSFGATPALLDLSFEVGVGELFGLLGPNGAGKTTLARIASTLLNWEEGEVTLGGLDLRAQRGEARQLIGLVPQDLALYPSLTAYENLELFGRLYGLSGGALRNRIAWAFEVSGLEEHAHKPLVERLSGGMKRRLNFVVGLLHEPRILLLDEPSVGLDPQSRSRLFDTIRELNAQGVTVVYTSHQMDEVQALCRTAGIIDRGRVLVQDRIASLLKSFGRGVVSLRTARSLNGALPKLRNIGTVMEVSEDDSLVRLFCSDWNLAAASAIQLLSNEGIAVQSIDIVEPNLEAVFLQLTGRNLRDEG